jgi:hypothetical protein
MDVTSEEVANHLLDRSPHWNTSTRLTKELDWDDVHRREALIAAIVGAPSLGPFCSGCPLQVCFFVVLEAVTQCVGELSMRRGPARLSCIRVVIAASAYHCWRLRSMPECPPSLARSDAVEGAFVISMLMAAALKALPIAVVKQWQ